MENRARISVVSKSGDVKLVKPSRFVLEVHGSRADLKRLLFNDEPLKGEVSWQLMENEAAGLYDIFMTGKTTESVSAPEETKVQKKSVTGWSLSVTYDDGSEGSIADVPNDVAQVIDAWLP